MRTPKFSIKRFKKRNSVFYGIWVPAYLRPDGVGKYAYFHTKAQAELHRWAIFFGVSMDWLLGADESDGESTWKNRALAAERKLAAMKTLVGKLGDLTKDLTTIVSE